MIKRRNLDNSLIQWIMATTGLGPGIGEIFYVAPATSATSQFRSHLETQLGISDKISADPVTAEALMVAYRNDVMLVMPGAYVQTASLAWDKAHSHMVGLAGPVVGGDYGDDNAVNLYTTTTTVAEVLNLTGKNCHFINVGFDNNGANATNYAAFKLDGIGAYLKNCTILGNMNTTQSAAAACTSLRIQGDAMYPLIIGCVIGSDVWAERTGTANSQIRFDDSAQPNSGWFRDCQIRSRGNDADITMVSVAVTNALGVTWTFDNCGFMHTTHLTGAQGTSITSAFYFPSLDRDVEIVLHNCYATNVSEWTNQDLGNLLADMPIVGTGGGLTVEPTTATGA